MEGAVEVLKRCWEVKGWEDWDVTLGWMACPSLVDSVDSLWAQKTYGGAVRSEWVVRKWGQRTSPSFKMFGLWGIVKRTGVAGGRSRVQIDSALFCFYDIEWEWERYRTVEEAEDGGWGVVYTVRSLRILCTEGRINPVHVTWEGQRASMWMEWGAWFGGSKLRCSLLLIFLFLVKEEERHPWRMSRKLEVWGA